MKPEDVIELIKKGNENFRTSREDVFFTGHSEKQTPLITMLTCSDSRVQTTAILPDAINKIFTIENIGNQIATTEGSVDYGIYHLKTPVLLIMGHSDCGAIKAFASGYDEEPDTIKRELQHLQAALKNDADKISLVEQIHRNIQYQVQLAVNKYAKLINNDELAVLGAFYDFANHMKGGYGKLHILTINGKDQQMNT